MLAQILSQREMISKADIKLIRSLREKKFRDESGLFVVEGEKMVQEAVDSSFDVVNIFRKDEIGDDLMSRISMLNTPSPVLAIVRIPDAEPVGEIPDGLYLALDSVRDPGNLGTIVRLADWFGVEGIFASYDTVELFNPKTVQSTMGAIFRKRVTYCNLEDVCRSFTGAGKPVYGTFMDGDNIYSSELRQNALVVMGNEARGISPAISRMVTSRIHIPSFAEGPTAESLNVAIATAVTISEFRRRTV